MKTLLLCGMLAGVAGTAGATDWPQWRGPNRDGKSTETGLLQEWPEGGPKLLWSNTALAPGYSPVTVVKDTIYVTGNDNGQGILFALDLAGKVRWQQPYGAELPGSTKYHPSRNAPTIDGDRLYILSSQGDLSCFDAASGRRHWGFNILEKFQGQNIKWAICESLLVDGDRLIVTPGGPAGMVALNKRTGEVVWKSSLNDNSAYCSPVLVPSRAGQVLVQLMASGVVGVDPKSGQPLWRHAFQNRHAVHANTPVFGDNILFMSAGYGLGAIAWQLAADGQTKELYRQPEFAVHHGGMILVDGHVYAATDKGAMCVELATGKVAWGPVGTIGKGAITYADGRLYCYSERGQVHLVKASSAGCEVTGMFAVTQGSGEYWAHPVVAGGRLYLRRGAALHAYDIRKR